MFSECMQLKGNARILVVKSPCSI